jgi:hypothetical protein
MNFVGKLFEGPPEGKQYFILDHSLRTPSKKIFLGAFGAPIIEAIYLLDNL